MPTSVTWRGTVDGSVGVTYDKNFNVTGQTIDGGNNVSFGYDNDGLLTSVGPMTLSYNTQNGLLTGTSLGSVTTSQGYSSFGELSSYTASYAGSPMFERTYGRDSLGRITTLAEVELGVTKTMKYAYDSVGRLEKVWRNDTLVSQYVYDANGNRIAHWTPTEIDSGTYDAQDRMLSYAGAQYFYTANGDLETKISGTDTTKYTYDALGNLMKVVMPNGDVIQYVVDGQNRRIARKLNGRITNKWLYAGQLTPVAELDSANNVIERFSGGYLERNDSVYQIITDQLGSPRLVVNVATGVVVQRMNYDAFGNVTYDSNPGFQPFGFAGGLYDPETKLVRFGLRDYDSEIGRWTSKDPIQFDGGVNFMSYCDNDPINRVDRSGLCPPCGGGGANGSSGGRSMTLSDANFLYRYGGGASVYMDLSALDLSRISASDFPKGIGSSRAFNLLAPKYIASLNDGLIYGNITLTLIDKNHVVATYGYDLYNFDWKPLKSKYGLVGNLELFGRDIETMIGKINAGWVGTPYRIYLCGQGTIGN